MTLISKNGTYHSYHYQKTHCHYHLKQGTHLQAFALLTTQVQMGAVSSLLLNKIFYRRFM